MVSDLKCPKCWKAVHPCSYDTHLEKCNDWLEYGVEVALTDDLIRHIVKSDSIESWNTAYGVSVLRYAMNFCRIPISDRQYVLSEIHRFATRSMCVIKLRSKRPILGLYKIEEGNSSCHRITLGRNVLKGFRLW